MVVPPHFGTFSIIFQSLCQRQWISMPNTLGTTNRQHTRFGPNKELIWFPMSWWGFCFWWAFISEHEIRIETCFPILLLRFNSFVRQLPAHFERYRKLDDFRLQLYANTQRVNERSNQTAQQIIYMIIWQYNKIICLLRIYTRFFSIAAAATAAATANGNPFFSRALFNITNA